MPSFAAVLPAPISWNAAYRIVKPRNSPRMTLAKTDTAWQWQTIAAAIIARAKPADFAPSGQIRVRYRFYLHRSMDADNCMKITGDAIAYGLGTKMGKSKPLPVYDDKWFLPCCEVLESGHTSPRTEVTLEWEQ